MGGLMSFFLCSNGRNSEVVGYWENWVDVKWWDNDIPGNCLMGCAIPQALMSKIQSYSVVNYGFVLLTENPNPDQVNCTGTNTCPEWDGKALYAAKSSKPGAVVLTPSTTVDTYTPALVSMSEVCRLVRMGPHGPKRCKIVLGGWSDWARIGSTDKAQKIAKLVAKMVLLTFADGIDLDFEHLSEYSQKYVDEFEPFNALIEAISSEFNKIKSQWVATANKRIASLLKAYNNLPAWQKKKAFYYPTNMHYLEQVAKNGPPEFEVSWTTRFNAFVDPNDPYNIYDPDSPHPIVPFITDNEGAKIWPKSSKYLGSANIMAYDAGSSAGALKLNFKQILQNFKTIGGCDPSKVNMGFEPGNQYAGGQWEGLERDMNVTNYVVNNGYGGVMIWAINPNPSVAPEAAHWVPILSSKVYQRIAPKWPYGKAPVYDKCDPTTGWWSNRTVIA